MIPALSPNLPTLIGAPPTTAGGDVAPFTLALTALEAPASPAAPDRHQLAAPGKSMPDISPNAPADPLAWLIQEPAAMTETPRPTPSGDGTATTTSQSAPAERSRTSRPDLPGFFVAPASGEARDSAQSASESIGIRPEEPSVAKHPAVPEPMPAAAAPSTDTALSAGETERVGKDSELAESPSPAPELPAPLNPLTPPQPQPVLAETAEAQARLPVIAAVGQENIESVYPTVVPSAPEHTRPSGEAPILQAATEAAPGKAGRPLPEHAASTASVPQIAGVPSPAPIESDQSSRLAQNTATVATAARPPAPVHDGSVSAHAVPIGTPEPPVTSTGPKTPSAVIAPVPVALAAPVSEAESLDEASGLPGQPRTERALSDAGRPASAAPPAQPQQITRALSSGPASQVFAAAIRRVARDARPIPAPELQALAAPAGQAVPVTIHTPMPLDFRQELWPSVMVERIERLRDAADAADTRIRLIPDALGSVEVSVKRDGEAVHVHFAAEQAATRTLIQDAAPRLAEAAEARGLKLGQMGVGGGNADANGGRQQPPVPSTASPPARARPVAPGEDDTDTRIA